MCREDFLEIIHKIMHSMFENRVLIPIEEKGECRGEMRLESIIGTLVLSGK